MRGMDQMRDPSGLGFMKMHGAGNDFVVIDSRGQKTAVVTPALARALGDRNRGVGFDQLAEIRDSDQADFGLDFWNNDGSRAGACGNATRCVSDYMMRLLGKNAVTLVTARGGLSAVRLADGRVSVNMGAPPASSSRMICSKMLRVRSSWVLASRITKAERVMTNCLTSAKVM